MDIEHLEIEFTVLLVKCSESIIIVTFGDVQEWKLGKWTDGKEA